MISNLQPLGPFTFVTGTEIGENTLVSLDTNGNLVVCPADGVPIGHTLYYYKAAGMTATLYQCVGQSCIKAGAAFAIGDYLKSDANGRLICNGTTGSTANDIKTVAVALSPASADGDFAKVQFKGAA